MLQSTRAIEIFMVCAVGDKVVPTELHGPLQHVCNDPTHQAKYSESIAKGMLKGIDGAVSLGAYGTDGEVSYAKGRESTLTAPSVSGVKDTDGEVIDAKDGESTLITPSVFDEEDEHDEISQILSLRLRQKRRFGPGIVEALVIWRHYWSVSKHAFVLVPFSLHTPVHTPWHLTNDDVIVFNYTYLPNTLGFYGIRPNTSGLGACCQVRQDVGARPWRYLPQRYRPGRTYTNTKKARLSGVVARAFDR
jgi:hypothetical protein